VSTPPSPIYGKNKLLLNELGLFMDFDSIFFKIWKIPDFFIFIEPFL